VQGKKYVVTPAVVPEQFLFRVAMIYGRLDDVK